MAIEAVVLGVICQLWPIVGRFIAAAVLVAAVVAFNVLLLYAGRFNDGLAGLGNAVWAAGTGWMDILCDSRVLAALIGLGALYVLVLFRTHDPAAGNSNLAIRRRGRDVPGDLPGDLPGDAALLE